MDSITTWSQALVAEDRSAHTTRAYVRAVRQFAAWFEAERHESFAPGGMTPIDLIAYRQQLQQQQQAAASINQQLAALRAFAAWSVAAGHRSDNPATRLRDVALQAQRAPKALEAKQINALLRTAQEQHPRDYAMVQVLAQTGMRLSECAALRLGDIAITERMGQIIIRAGKGNKQRKVPANASVRGALAEYLGLRWDVAPTIKAVLVVWEDRPGDTPLWVGQRGALSARSIARTIEELVAPLARRGLLPDGTSAHTLRHTFATSYLADNPGDLVGLAALLGHSSLETTRIYVEQTDEELARRVEAGRLNAY